MNMINQKKDDSVEYNILSPKIYDVPGNFMITDKANSKAIFNLIFVNAVTADSNYESVLGFYKNLINLSYLIYIN